MQNFHFFAGGSCPAPFLTFFGRDLAYFLIFHGKYLPPATAPRNSYMQNFIALLLVKKSTKTEDPKKSYGRKTIFIFKFIFKFP